MNLSSSEVEDKAFTQALRGYQMDEVDDFLDEVVTALKAHEQRLHDAQDRIRSLESDLASRGGDETTISRAFLAAQRSADALIAEAQSQAEKIHRAAEIEAARLLGERDAERKSMLDEISSIRGAVAALKARLSELAGKVGADIATMDDALSVAETEVQEPTSDDESVSDSEPEESAVSIEEEPERAETEASPPPELVTSQPVANIVDELPTLDLTDEASSRVSARPWERG